MVEIPKGEKMEILYILTIIILGIAFMIFKKSEEKLNFIKWMIIFVVTLYGYNIVIGMVLGLLNITSHIWLLSRYSRNHNCICNFWSNASKRFIHT